METQSRGLKVGKKTMIEMNKSVIMIPGAGECGIIFPWREGSILQSSDSTVTHGICVNS